VLAARRRSRGSARANLATFGFIFMRQTSPEWPRGNSLLRYLFRAGIRVPPAVGVPDMCCSTQASQHDFACYRPPDFLSSRRQLV
jgi:hypothetical protein